MAKKNPSSALSIKRRCTLLLLMVLLIFSFYGSTISITTTSQQEQGQQQQRYRDGPNKKKPPSGSADAEETLVHCAVPMVASNTTSSLFNGSVTTTTTTTPVVAVTNDAWSLLWLSDPSTTKNESIASIVFSRIQAGDFPITRFTPHVNSIVDAIDVAQMQSFCKFKFTFFVDQPFSVPTRIECLGKGRQRVVKWWCNIFHRLFGLDHGSDNVVPFPFPIISPILPTTVTIAISTDDFFKDWKDPPNACLASSSRNGSFCITNFLELQRMADDIVYDDNVPWHERCPIPIWRGSAWKRQSHHVDGNKGNAINNSSNSNASSSILLVEGVVALVPRLQAVLFSKQHPHLLDARISDPHNGFMDTFYSKEQARLWKNNATNGLWKLLPIHEIAMRSYYSDYQTAVVLCGLGAAFRTSIHFSTATAVVLQDCPQHEWFVHHNTHLLVPYQHYIPLDSELTNLREVLKWVAEHPTQVYEIAQRGRQFYQDYLSFERNYEHFYELIYRLAIKKQQAVVIHNHNHST